MTLLPVSKTRPSWKAPRTSAGGRWIGARLFALDRGAFVDGADHVKDAAEEIRPRASRWPAPVRRTEIPRTGPSVGSIAIFLARTVLSTGAVPLERQVFLGVRDAGIGGPSGR